MGFNSGFKGLNCLSCLPIPTESGLGTEYEILRKLVEWASRISMQADGRTATARLLLTTRCTLGNVFL